METVQAWLNKVDKEVLADTYFAAFLIDYMMIADRTLTLEEIRDRSKSRFIEFVREMKQVEIQQNDDPCVFFACRQYVEGYSRIGAAMCRLEDIRGEGQPECYAWSFTDFARVMGCFVAETSLTLKNMDCVLAEILHEMSLFGYHQEDMEAERARLLESAQEIGKGEYYSEQEVFEKLAAEFGWERPESDLETEELERAIRTAEYEYNSFCRYREIERIRETIRVSDSEESETYAIF